MSIDDDIASDVARLGWSCISISDTPHPFAYTVGLMFTLHHPELIIFGPRTNNPRILQTIVAQIRAGKSFAPPAIYHGILPNAPIATRPVHPSQHPLYLGFAMGYCTNHGRLGELEAVQIFWPDSQNRFPFTPNCDDASHAAQPRLDQPATPDELESFHRAIGTP